MPRKIRVALLFGGRSAEHEVSLVSARAVHRALDPRKYDVHSIYITPRGRWRIVASPLRPRRELATGPARGFLPWAPGRRAGGLDADIYFPVLHGPFGEDGTIQGLFEMAGVPFVGAGVFGSAAAMDKAAAKSLLRLAGLPVVPSVTVLEPDWRRDRDGVLRRLRTALPLPLFVKPANLGSSVGITKVKDLRRLAGALNEAFRYDRKAIVEKGIAGLEIEVSVLGNDAPEASVPGQIIPHREFYDYADKYEDGLTKFVVPASLNPAETRRVRGLAVAAYRTLDLAGMARVDFFLEDRTGRWYVSEANTIPGFTAISMYPRLWAASGLPFPALLDRLIALGFERHRARKICVERRGA
jgi:D-alanine-D-alanine ligase